MPGRQQRVLQGILGVVDRPQHPVAVHLQLSLVRADKLAERLPIARPGQIKQLPGHGDIVAHPRASCTPCD